MIRVCQAVNTSDYDNINGLSCIEYWKSNPNVNATILYCRAKDIIGTEDNPIVGGHVLGFIDGVPHVFITPILNSVNVSDEPKCFDVGIDDLVRIPQKDEQSILSDPENLKRLKMLDIVDKMKKLMR